MCSIRYNRFRRLLNVRGAVCDWMTDVLAVARKFKVRVRTYVRVHIEAY